MVKVLVVNKNSSGKTIVGESPLSFALSPESHEFQVAGRSSGLFPLFSAFPTRKSQ